MTFLLYDLKHAKYFQHVSLSFPVFEISLQNQMLRSVFTRQFQNAASLPGCDAVFFVKQCHTTYITHFHSSHSRDRTQAVRIQTFVDNA